MTMDVADLSILTIGTPHTLWQTETYISPEDIFTLPNPQSPLLSGLTFLKDVLTPEEETTLKRWGCSPIQFTSWSIHSSVLTAPEPTFSSDDSEAPDEPTFSPDKPSLPLREICSDTDSRRPGLHPPTRYDYPGTSGYLVPWGPPEPINPSYLTYWGPWNHYARYPGSTSPLLDDSNQLVGVQE